MICSAFPGFAADFLPYYCSMDIYNYTEFFGYAASAGVLISFLMRDIKWLRIVNSAGCIFFIIYGVLLTSWPVVVTNVAIVLVNFWYLFFAVKKAGQIPPPENRA